MAAWTVRKHSAWTCSKIIFFYHLVTFGCGKHEEQKTLNEDVCFTRLMFTFSRDSWSQAARVLFNSLYILARSCSALYYTRPLMKIFKKRNLWGSDCIICHRKEVLHTFDFKIFRDNDAKCIMRGNEILTWSSIC